MPHPQTRGGERTLITTRFPTLTHLPTYRYEIGQHLWVLRCHENHASTREVEGFVDVVFRLDGSVSGTLKEGGGASSVTMVIVQKRAMVTYIIFIPYLQYFGV